MKAGLVQFWLKGGTPKALANFSPGLFQTLGQRNTTVIKL